MAGAAPVVSRFPRYLDRLVPFPGFPGIPELPVDVGALPAFLAEAQRRRFDLALQMHGNGRVINIFTMLLGARVNAGFRLAGNFCPDPERFLPYPDREPEIRRHLRLLGFLGVPAQGEELEFPLREDDLAELERVEQVRGLEPGSFACLHAGAFAAARRWPAASFAAVGDQLARRGLQVLLTGSAAEAEVTRAVREAMCRPAVDLAGRTSLGALAALLARARLLVCNDTGVSHLATALGVPSVVIFSASDPDRWAPLDTRRHRALGRPGWAEADGGRPGPPGVEVRPEDVLVQADDLLGAGLRRAS